MGMKQVKKRKQKKNPKTDYGLISKIYKECIQFNSKTRTKNNNKNPTKKIQNKTDDP